MLLVAICLVIPQHMRLSGTVMEIWCLKFFQEDSSRNKGRLSVNPQYCTNLIYSSSLRLERSVRGLTKKVTEPGLRVQWMTNWHHIKHKKICLITTMLMYTLLQNSVTEQTIAGTSLNMEAEYINLVQWLQSRLRQMQLQMQCFELWGVWPDRLISLSVLHCL